MFRTGAIEKQNATYGEGSGNIVLDEVSCRGPETSIASCEHQGYRKQDCHHNEDVGVVCCTCFFCKLISNLSS